MKRPQRRLRRRLMLAFAGFTLAVATLFGLYAAVFVYMVEDRFFQSMLGREAAWLQQERMRSGEWPTPRDPSMRVFADTAALPPEIRDILLAEPQRREFAGANGLHYHLYPLEPASAASPWLLAEVSAQLVVRPLRGDLLRVLAWSGVGVLALALLLGGWLASRMTAPLARLASLVGTMTPDRLPAGFAGGFEDDEVGVLADALETLGARLRDFVARERAFTRDASHELRTPLAVIRGACERLSSQQDLTPRARADLMHVLQSAQALEQTVATLLALAREEHAAAEVMAQKLLPLVERVVLEQAPLLADRPVQVSVDVPAAATATLPPAVLQILLSNLIGNAFAHTSRGEVRIATAHGRLQIANRDASMHARIDEQDYAVFTHREGSAGFGLGLAILRRVCERHGVDLRIESDAAQTVASFPLAPVPATARTDQHT
jgi:signal transduction histidine kinase